MNKPNKKPNNPNFSSGPCSKRPGWSVNVLSDAVLGRSHRGKQGKAKLKQLIDLSKSLLNIPDNYLVGIVPASDTGAMEMAMWSLLGSHKVDVYAWEAFSKTWLVDVSKQLKLDCNQYLANYGDLPDFTKYNPDNDTVFVFNGTTSGVRVPNLDWVSDSRRGLVICDATSAVFSQRIDFSKLDVTTWSWQKALGGEAAHGMIVLSPRAVARLESYTPPWPMPKIFTLVKNGKLIDDIFVGSTINTPSLLCVEDCLDSMKWISKYSGVGFSQAISDKNLEIVRNWVDKTEWVDFLANDPKTVSNTSICLKVVDPEFNQKSEEEQRKFLKTLCLLLEEEKVAYDINAYKSAPPGLRIWGGVTVMPEDVESLLPWIDWAYKMVKDTH